MSLIEKAKTLFCNPNVPDSLNEANQMKWCAAIEYLADKWILAKPVERKVMK